jgi:hypothetical protein
MPLGNVEFAGTKVDLFVWFWVGLGWAWKDGMCVFEGVNSQEGT